MFVLAVGFVDDQEVDHFQQAALDALQFVALAGGGESDERVGHVGDIGFALADADGFDENDVVAGGFAHEHALAGFAGDAAEGAGAGRGADVRVRVGGEVGHAGFVAEDAAAGDAARGVDGEDGDAVAGTNQLRAERFDEGAFARAGGAADADADRTAGVGHEAGEELFGQELMLRVARFDQRERAGEDGEVAGADAGEVFVDGEVATEGTRFGVVVCHGIKIHQTKTV